MDGNGNKLPANAKYYGKILDFTEVTSFLHKYTFLSIFLYGQTRV